MFRIGVLSAENIPVLTKSVWKTRIYCFSSSSCRYFYGSFKNKEKTTNPKWNDEINVDLFRCSILSFILYSSRLLSHEVYLGRVDIDITNFLKEETGKQILITSQSCVQCNFPITSCSSPNASLSLSFSYYPKIYRPIQYKSISLPIIHVFTTYTPSIESCPVEIELLQAYYIDEKKNGLNGLFYNFNKITDWETVGFSSHDRYFQGPTGQTQIHTFLPHRLNSKYHFFILNNNSNYEGVVTLNFIAEKEGKYKTFNDQIYFEPCTKSCIDGTIKTVDVHCRPNKKICFPIIMNYTQKIIKKDICEFISFPCIEYDKNDEMNEYPIEFYSKIIEEAKSIVPNLKDVKFQRTNVMTDCNEKISLLKLFNDLNLQNCLNLRIYVGGSTSTNSDDYDDYSYDYFDSDSDINFLETRFCVFDKKESKRCNDIEKSLSKKPNLVCPLFGNYKRLYGMKWNSYVNLNLDQFDINKVFVFNCFCRAPLSLADEDGFYMISQIHDDVETLLIRNLVFADKIKSHFVTCFRLEFIEDGWEIIPMRHFFKTKKKMNSTMEILFSNNWILPDDFQNPISTKELDSSNEEILIDNAEI